MDHKEWPLSIGSKILHSILSNDEFYVVLPGHSAAADHDNDFSQSQSMQFNSLMEPIFDRLGMCLITQNMAMGGLGTVHSSLGRISIYGEQDLFIWESATT